MSFSGNGKKTIIAQFWVGKFSDEALFHDFTGEDPEHYAIENEDGDYPLSKFAASQGETFYDHDFMEVAFSDVAVHSGKEFMASWSDKWADELDRRINELDVSDLNVLVMMVVEQHSSGKLYRQISNPVSASGEGFNLTYLGEIEFDDYSKEKA
ncbi:immunity 22 family protein [Roseibium sediminis]|uniref:immunity 22 family protein n=1 Tax=Roseibium sediminis TaxID=1775174 RepID=UPI00123D972A|nr:immunity 22 family protein [Roseibium sediminis]